MYDEMKERGALVDEWHAALARIAELEAEVKRLTEALVRAHASMDNAVSAIKQQTNALHLAATDAYHAWDFRKS